MTDVAFHVEGMTCEGCENSIQRAVGQIPGVESVRADHAARVVEVSFAAEPDEGAVRAAVEGAGFDYVGRRDT